MDAVVADLLGEIEADAIVVDPDVLESYRFDQAALAPAGRAAVVVRAQSVDDVVATLRVASRHRRPVVTRGAGTGLSGGANATDGCIVLSTVGMGRILEIDPRSRTATVQCGVLNGDLAAAVQAESLWYPPDPASRAISTIGGNIATNAGGACCLKYGVTGDHVAAITSVLADGSVIRTGRPVRKDVAGLDLKSLLVGSEGTLAVIVEATLNLRPRQRPPSTLVAFFSSPDEAGDAVVAIEATAEPSLLEFMDRTTIGAVEAMVRMDLDTGAGALLLVQCDAPASDEEIARVADACTQSGTTYLAHTTDAEEGEQLLAARRAALPALEKMGTTLLDDVAVPKHRISALLASIDQVAHRYDLVIGTFGHAGDGNLHPTIVFRSNDEASAAAAAFEEIVLAAVGLGGSITGEHGVGTLKSRYLSSQHGGAELDLMARIKAAFDPAGILNPGKVLRTPLAEHRFPCPSAVPSATVRQSITGPGRT